MTLKNVLHKTVSLTVIIFLSACDSFAGEFLSSNPAQCSRLDVEKTTGSPIQILNYENFNALKLFVDMDKCISINSSANSLERIVDLTYLLEVMEMMPDFGNLQIQNIASSDDINSLKISIEKERNSAQVVLRNIADSSSDEDVARIYFFSCQAIAYMSFDVCEESLETMRDNLSGVFSKEDRREIVLDFIYGSDKRYERRDFLQKSRLKSRNNK